MKQTFIIDEGLDCGTEQSFCALLTGAVGLWRAGEFQASLDMLSKAEPMLESVSADRRGRFYNSRALALRGLGKLDPAIIDYEGAAVFFEEAGDSKLQAIVKNNAAWCYSLLGDHAQAHESVDAAIELVSDKELLAEFHDLKAQIFLNEGKIKHSNRVKCLSNMVQDPSPDSPRSPRRTNEMLRAARINAERIIRDNHDLAASLISLLVLVADPNGDPDRYSAADAAMGFLFAFTPQGEQDYRSYLAKLQLIDSQPQVDHLDNESEFSS